MWRCSTTTTTQPQTHSPLPPPNTQCCVSTTSYHLPDRPSQRGQIPETPSTRERILREGSVQAPSSVSNIVGRGLNHDRPTRMWQYHQRDSDDLCLPTNTEQDSVKFWLKEPVAENLNINEWLHQHPKTTPYPAVMGWGGGCARMGIHRDPLAEEEKSWENKWKVSV